ncbi:MAG: hemolysin family protein [Gammaproteobacteria bacterium]|nr:hemolysin family protein [Gammaproteobacteria bacterium]
MQDFTLNILLIVFLLAANGFFVAAEFALVKSRGFRIQSRADQGSRAARLTVQIQKELEHYLAACQLGITMASLGLGWIGEPAVAALLEPLFHKIGLSDQLLHTVSFLLGFLLFSSLHIVVGEQVPKTLAIRKADAIAIGTAYLLHGFYLISYPLNWSLNRASNMILRWLGVERAEHDDVLSNDELRGLIDTSSQHGELEIDKAEMLHNLFEFDQRAVERIMISRTDVDVLNLKASSETHRETMRQTQHSRLPVVDADQDNLVGILLVKDLYIAMLNDETDPWQNLRRYVREPLVIPETSPVGKVFETMRGTRNHLACLVDEYGVFTGIVTMEDLLEEIVGEISDELDTHLPEYPVVSKDDGWIAHGLTPLSDVSRITGFQPASDVDASTLSGLFMLRLGRIPKVHDDLVENSYRLVVKEMSHRRVQQVIIHVVEEIKVDDRVNPESQVEDQLHHPKDAETNA